MSRYRNGLAKSEVKMRFLVAATSIGLAIGYTVAGTSSAHAAANVIDAQNSCMAAAACARQAENERESKSNPGMGRKFNNIKQDCTALAEKCQRDMKAPEPRRIPQKKHNEDD